MPPSIIAPSPAAVSDIKVHVKSGHVHANIEDALVDARARFAVRNKTSLQMHEEATKSLPGGNTRSLLHTAPFPLYLKKGEDWKVFSEDGDVYTDLVGEMTAGLFGHSQPLIQQTLINTIQNIGLNLGGTTVLESQLASHLSERFSLPLIRFTNSGTEANLHALQAAKYFTGKRKVVVFSGGYHGGCFSFPESEPAVNCVDKEEWIVAEYNDIEDTRRKIEESGDVAAVVVEGMQGHGPYLAGTSTFLQQVQTSAKKVGAVFILDEVMTSRLSGGGLKELEGLEPDIVTMGKYIGGGVTFGCFGGSKEVMRVYDPRENSGLAHSGTFNNNTLTLSAGFVGMSQIYTPDVAREFNAMGDRFREKLQKISEGTKMTVTGRGSLIGIHFLEDGRKELGNYRERKDIKELRELFWFEMMEEGFWVTQRVLLALILGTPWEELERFAGAVEGFLKKYNSLVQL
ncbi:PLP-dependent transferase [Periconia macrospinosa]|uniref:PLP-dependent transferase n=1 Tax=Periconia macrospinosa TaxID=97972 RepID=A0A2V1D8U1_9PLEO|nr:PLP-dependent transferase [Periconia macrospinosa]